MKTKKILLVDPFGSNFAHAIESLNSGYDTYAIMSSCLDEIPDEFLGHFKESVFKKIFWYNCNTNLYEELRELKPDAVIPCDQLSLRITDYISDYLRLPGNPSQTIRSRVNKGLLRRKLKEKGFNDVDFLQANDLNRIISWVNQRNYPVILKPPESAGGSLFVKKCSNEDELRKAFNMISNMKGTFERNITGEVLAEEYLDGDEFIVNMMHSDGQRFNLAIAGVEKIQRRGNASIYKNVFSMDTGSDFARELFDYTAKISNALDVRIGINDTEVKKTSKGIRLVEMNNRMPGASLPYAIEKCCGFNLYRANIELFSGKSFRPEIKYNKYYNICYLINDSTGVVKGLKGLDKVRNLDSYDFHEIYAEEDKLFPETTDLTNSWGRVILVHSKRDQLKRDAQFVHDNLKLIME